MDGCSDIRCGARGGEGRGGGGGGGGRGGGGVKCVEVRGGDYDTSLFVDDNSG